MTHMTHMTGMTHYDSHDSYDQMDLRRPHLSRWTWGDHMWPDGLGVTTTGHMWPDWPGVTTPDHMWPYGLGVTIPYHTWPDALGLTIPDHISPDRLIRLRSLREFPSCLFRTPEACKVAYVVRYSEFDVPSESPRARPRDRKFRRFTVKPPTWSTKVFQ